MRALFAVVVLGVVACRPASEPVAPAVQEASASRSAWQIYEVLEAEIDAGGASDEDRQVAFKAAADTEDDGTAQYAFARAALAGRAAELRGLKAVDRLEQAASWARRSIERDPAYEKGAARRMLGTLYVLAGRHLDKGDSETGLELLEEVVDEFPDVVVSRLRLAEGYVALGDPEPAYEHLCEVLPARESLRPGERELLAILLEEVGGEEALGCAAG